MRRVSVLFVNLGFQDKELASMLDESFAIRLNRAFRCVQDGNLLVLLFNGICYQLSMVHTIEMC